MPQMPHPRRIHARLLVVVALLCLLLPVAGHARAEEQNPAIVIDRQTGDVLFADHAFDRWYPASLTKLMTFYVTLRAIAADEIQPGSPVVISKYAASQPPSRLGLKQGTRIRLDNAIPIVVIKSANDVAAALAEAVAGSLPAFVERMNAEAKRLGMTDSHFANANGLHSPDQYVSARDMALLARQILIEFPQYENLFSAPAIKFGDEVEHSYNLLLGRFAGADGMKTGFVCASGYNFVASATRNGRQLIAVTLGQFSQTDRAVEGARLLMTGFEKQSGPKIGEFVRTGPPVPAQSQRNRICSKQALEKRYDPGAGQAVIDSPLLQKDLPTAAPIEVSLGEIDADPSAAWLNAHMTPQRSVPVPSRRPQYPASGANGAQADMRPAADPTPAVTSVASVPVPTPRPEQ